MQIKISNINDVIVLLKSIMEDRIAQHIYEYVINTKLINKKIFIEYVLHSTSVQFQWAFIFFIGELQILMRESIFLFLSNNGVYILVKMGYKMRGTKCTVNMHILLLSI